MTTRTHQIIELLVASPVITASRIATACNVSEQTGRNDLAAVEAVGVVSRREGYRVRYVCDELMQASFGELEA